MKRIRDFFEYYQKFAFDKDIPGMTNLYDGNILIFDMWGKGFSTGISEWSSTITNWLTSLKDEKVEVDFEHIDIQEDEHVGFASAIIQYKAIAPDGAVLRSMKNRISLGFVKNEGFWKVRHQHTSAPIDSNLTAILDI